VNGYRVAAVELPVEWKRGAERLEKAIRDLRPVAVISFGEGSPGVFELEEVAHNKANPNLTDNKNERFTKKKIKKNGPDEIRTSLPLAALLEAIKPILPSNLDVRTSQDAGAYLCEYVFYLGRYYLKKYDLESSPSGFNHVPYSGGGSTRTDFTVDATVVATAVQVVADELERRRLETNAADSLPPPAPAATRGFGGSLSTIGEVSSATR
jgi:pyrrolidone-carboxylate peptidase